MSPQTLTMLFVVLLVTLLATISLHRLHLLSMLLLMEALILTTVLWVLLTTHLHTPFILIFILTPAVCEAALGLALFVMITRTTGNDMLKSSALITG
uniref:NADH-ubiquinone oxidoreductase chain 4L n=1 Tax=Sabella spallanzanii TaxID=85702 RepID=A0A7T1WKZ6_SABSP|nr:NADH dehydrogenase subunit 4L [Sabella spallanzanii]QPO99964.1 NADH dehydrogenase subunit 4L [Sabella spallanzanii]UJM44186.1 NADH dehydrogenase subunit 4L [Sabella spallanzanii]UYP50930.1 NADH dehydrogenase subunit 4L [Sabella spallanzanii]